jgi:hypothetical protein
MRQSKSSKRKKTKRLKVGDIVLWDFSGDWRKGKSGLAAGPLKIDSFKGSRARISGPSITCLGTFKAIVPTKELLPYE